MKAHVLADKINSVLRDNKYDRYVSGKTRGKLDFSSLAKIAYSPKVFMKREARQNKDYKVIVLADASGSMGGDGKVEACADSLELIANALENTDVEYALWSFAGDIISLKDFAEKKPGSVRKLYMQHFEERLIYMCYSCITAFGSFKGDLTGCPECGHVFSKKGVTHQRRRSYGFNVDGLALHLAFENIQKLPGNHIIVVLSDGQADCTPGRYHYMNKEGSTYLDFPLRKVVEKVKKTKTVLCSIGILCSDVLDFYPKENTVVLRSADELGGALVGLIKKQIKRG